MGLSLRSSFFLAGTIALLCTAMASAPGIHAAALIVTSTADSGVGSLRDTIAAASDGNTIQFDAALNGQTITITSELVIDKSITISGPGPDLLTVGQASNGHPAALRTLAETQPNVLAVWKVPDAPEGFRIFHILPGQIVLIEGLTISGAFFGGLGGGILNEQATLTVNNCAVERNLAFSGCGIYSDGSTAILTIVNSTVTLNTVNGGGAGGGIYNDGGMMTMTGSTVDGNSAHSAPFANGGGIVNGGTMEISQSTISGNFAGYTGGGILNGGALTITDSIVSGNHAGTIAPGSGTGGGIYNIGGGSATLTITNCTISGNEASGKNSGTGGGIRSDRPLTITNSTVSGNFANRDGGGISTGGSSATLTITNSTVSGNRANQDGGGIHNGNSGTLEIGNTILNAGASGANIFNNGGNLSSLGYNLSSDNGGGFLTATGDQINTNPLLGPLQNNGGPTFTHALLTDSPALNAGDPNFTPPPLYDQRGPGYHRVFSGRIDIGSLEVQPAPTPSPTASPTPSATATPPVTPTPSGTPSPSPAQALNISTRLRVETGNNVLIGGFIIAGNVPKNVAVRGIGPSLISLGLNDALADPTLELRAGNGALIVDNDNWQDNLAQAAQLTALGLAPPHPNESGIVATLNPGASYTAILAGKNAGIGVGLVEIYDTNQGVDSQLVNISTRGFVQTGNNVMIGGFILGGNANSGIAVRGIGPSLGQFGLSPLLANPTLELRDSNGALLIANNNWQDDPVSAAQLTAHGLAPQNSLESGIFASLPPGAFTAILAGENGGVGIGLVEIYNVH